MSDYIEEQLEQARKAQEPDVVTVKGAVESYITLRSTTLSPSTIRGYRMHAKAIPDWMNEMPAADVQKKDIDALVRELRATEIRKDKDGRPVYYKPKTVREKTLLVVQAIREACPDKILTAEIPAAETTEPYIPTAEDIRKLFAEAGEGKYQLPLYLGCYGLRRSEVCALMYEDVDFKTHTIHIHQSMVQDEAGDWQTRARNKTFKSTRDIIVSETVTDLIRQKVKPGHRLYDGSPGNITSWMEKAEKRLGLPRFSFHKLRHYFVSSLHTEGVPDAVIMAMGGYSTDVVMKRVYRHAQKSAIEEGAKTAAACFGSLLED